MPVAVEDVVSDEGDGVGGHAGDGEVGAMLAVADGEVGVEGMSAEGEDPRHGVGWPVGFVQADQLGRE